MMARRCSAALLARVLLQSPSARLGAERVCRDWAVLGSAPGELAPTVYARAFAKGTNTLPKTGVTPPANTVGLGGGGALRAVFNSPNVLAEPYAPLAPLPIHTLLTADGWRQRGQRLLGKAKNVYTLAKVRKDVPNWTLAGFKAEAIDIFSLVCAAIASGDRNVLRHAVTDSVLADVKRELKAREAGGWARVSWQLHAVEEVSVVHGRLVSPNKDLSLAFAQLTVALRSTQRFAAFNARGARVAGDEAQLVRVQDYWVLERAIGAALPESMRKWRLAGRLNSAALQKTA